MDALYKLPFPNLSGVAAKKTSDKTDRYNCIAWAFRDSRRHWWPNQRRSYWPIDTLGLSIAGAFEKWFVSDGWEQCDSGDLDVGFEKIALFGTGGVPKHAARQLPTGLWTSKLGPDIDLSHTLNDLIGPAYGAPMRFYRKPI
jgi:hypothetical protein